MIKMAGALARQEEQPVMIDWRERFYDAQTQSIKEDIRDLKDDVKELRQDIKRIDGKINDLNDKIDGVRDELSKEIKALNNKMNENLWKMILAISIVLGIFNYLTK